MRAFLLLTVLSLAACAPAPAGSSAPATLPDADAATERGIRAVWATLQDAARTGDASALAALEDPDPGNVDPGFADDAAAAIVTWTQTDAALREAILTTRAFDLARTEEGRYVFTYSPPDGPQPDGYEITFRQAADGEVFLTTAAEIG